MKDDRKLQTKTSRAETVLYKKNEAIEVLDYSGHDKKQSIKRLQKKNLSCNNCDQTFFSKTDQQNHIKKFDGIIKTCNQCEYKSCHNYGLSMHKKKVHKNKVDKKPIIETEKAIKTQTKHTPLQKVKKPPINEAIEVLDRFGKDKKQNASVDKKPVTIETEKVIKTQTPPPQAKKSLSKKPVPQFVIPQSQSNLQCPKCDQTFLKKTDLEFHKGHSKSKLISCGECSFVSCTEQGMTSHKLLHNIKNTRKKEVISVSKTKNKINKHRKQDDSPLVQKKVLDYFGNDKKDNEKVDKEPIFEMEMAPIKTQTKHTLIRPKKGRWIVKLEKNLDLLLQNEKKFETAKELNNQIMAESLLARLTVQPPGRPPKKRRLA